MWIRVLRNALIAMQRIPLMQIIAESVRLAFGNVLQINKKRERDETMP